MAVNMNLTPFLMLPVLPIILIHSSPAPELATAVTLALLAASRRSRLTYRHIRTT